MFTRNAGVNGSAIKSVKFPRLIFLNTFLYLFIFSLFSVNTSNFLPSPFLKIKYDITQPIIVNTHEIKNPKKLPKLTAALN